MKIQHWTILNYMLDLSSILLNIMLRKKLFKLANKLILFRKKYIIRKMLKINKKKFN